MVVRATVSVSWRESELNIGITQKLTDPLPAPEDGTTMVSSSRWPTSTDSKLGATFADAENGPAVSLAEGGAPGDLSLWCPNPDPFGTLQG